VPVSGRVREATRAVAIRRRCEHQGRGVPSRAPRLRHLRAAAAAPLPDAGPGPALSISAASGLARPSPPTWVATWDALRVEMVVMWE
jgi:hypothetical protein